MESDITICRKYLQKNIKILLKDTKKLLSNMIRAFREEFETW